MQQFYDSQTERIMRQVYESFSEKDRRIYAAIETKKLPYGGLSYISNIFDCDIKSIRRGLIELEHLDDLPQNRSRRPGGGRKKQIDQLDTLDECFLKVLQEHTAGDPMQAGRIWTDLSPSEIRERLKREGIEIGESIVKQLLDKHGYAKRKARKSKRTGSCNNRNEQFEKIGELKAHYQSQGNPIISIDAKKKKN